MYCTISLWSTSITDREAALPACRAESCPADHAGEIEADWLNLQGRADCSYFQSWGWIGTWLEVIALDLNPCVIRVYCGETLTGLGIFVPAQIHRNTIIRSSALFLNEYPFDGRDMVVEYNGLLADNHYRSAVYSKVIEYLLDTYRQYEEFYFGALHTRDLVTCLNASESQLNGVRAHEREVSTTWSVDLIGLAHGLEGFLATLSKNRRTQIRRAFKLHEAQGALQLEEAGSLGQVFEYFEGLKRLHTARWHSKGITGAFGNPLWERFHRALITARFVHGEIQLLKMSNGSGEIGYLYNLIWRRHVYVLQTGFRIGEDKRLMPGYVAHTLAIVHNKQNGMTTYDLMHSDDLYKRILCNQRDKLHWLVFQRKRWKFALEDRARAIKRRYAPVGQVKGDG